MKDLQKDMILDLLEDGIGLTALDALIECSCLRLAARICDLRRDGYDIVTIPRQITNGVGNTKIVADYYLV